MKLWLETTQILSSFFSLSLFSLLLSSFLCWVCVWKKCGYWVAVLTLFPLFEFYLICFLQTKNWVQSLGSKQEFEWELKKKRKRKRKRKRKGIVNWVKNCELWVMRMKNWDMDVLRTKHCINFQIFDHTSICPIWALN